MASKITSRRLRGLIGHLSFLLVPNMALAKVNIHEHRTKQTYESYMGEECLLLYQGARYVGIVTGASS